MKILSHRAINKKTPENSLPAIRQAFESGYGIETDVRVNKSGSLVMTHDATAENMFGVNKKFIDMTDEECSKLYNIRLFVNVNKVGNYQQDPNIAEKKIRLATLEQVFDVYKEVGNNVLISLHIKDIFEPYVVDKTVAMIRDYKLQENTILFAVDGQTQALAEKIRSDYEDIRVAVHIPENSMLYNEDFLNTLRPGKDAVWLDEESGKWLTIENIELFKKKGLVTIVMSPEFVPNNKYADKYEEKWGQYEKIGFDYVLTDFADKLEEFLR